MEHQPDFIDNLIALKDYYQAQIEEYQRQIAHAQAQLNHVNALLDDQMARYKQQKARLSETEVDLDTSALASASNSPPDTSPPVSPEPDLASAIGKPLASTEHSATLESTQLPATTELTELDSTDFARNEEPVADFAINEALAAEATTTTENTSYSQLPLQPTASPVATDSKTERYRQGPPQKTPLLPQFQHLSKSEALEKFLQDNEGKAFYIDDITRALYGELEADVIRAERPRIYDTLKKGLARGLWSAVPDSTNYYTIDLKPQEPKVIPPNLPPKTSSKSSRRSKYSDSMLPRYRQLSFTEAVATVVQENAGQVLTPEQVTRELYGDIPAKDLTLFQRQVNKTLWAGAKQGQWQPVPGQVGCYTWNLSLLKS